MITTNLLATKGKNDDHMSMEAFTNGGTVSGDNHCTTPPHPQAHSSNNRCLRNSSNVAIARELY